MGKTYQYQSNFHQKLYKEFTSKDRDKIAEIIHTKQSTHWLSPTVDEWVYGTTRALDFGDYHGVLDRKALYEHAINKNADYFDITILEEEHPDKKLPRYLTFRTAALFENHQSQFMEKSIGLLFDAVIIKDKYDDMHVTTLFGVDKKKAPHIARTLEKYPERVPFSMGCSIKGSTALCCGKEIIKDSDMCEHLRFNRGGRHEGRRVAEFLKGVDFYELSVVTSPACVNSYGIDAIAEIVPGRLLKVAQESSDGLEVARLMSTIYNMIHEASALSEKKRLSNQLDILIQKLENLYAHGALQNHEIF